MCFCCHKLLNVFVFGAPTSLFWGLVPFLGCSAPRSPRSAATFLAAGPLSDTPQPLGVVALSLQWARLTIQSPLHHAHLRGSAVSSASPQPFDGLNTARHPLALLSTCRSAATGWSTFTSLELRLLFRVSLGLTKGWASPPHCTPLCTLRSTDWAFSRASSSSPRHHASPLLQLGLNRSRRGA